MAKLPQAEGQRLAKQMLLEMRDEIGADELVLEAANRGGRPQSDVLVRYLAQLVDHQGKRGGAELAAGFIAVLQDFIGSALDGATPDPERYSVKA